MSDEKNGGEINFEKLMEANEKLIPHVSGIRELLAGGEAAAYVVVADGTVTRVGAMMLAPDLFDDSREYESSLVFFTEGALPHLLKLQERMNAQGIFPDVQGATPSDSSIN